MKRNPAVSAAQYRLAEAVLHGTARSKTQMSKKAAKELIEKTPARLRSEFMRSNPSDAYKAGYAGLKAGASRYGTVNLSPSIAQREEWGHAWSQFMAGWRAAQKEKENAGKKSRRKFKKAARKRLGLIGKHAKRNNGKKRNPEDTAIAAYRDTHGQLPKRDTFVQTKLAYHKNLAGMGRLLELVIFRMDGKGEVTVSGFGKDCMLALNESQSQLFIVGGNQAVDLKCFGIKEPHESEVLGTCRSVAYFTEKVHLIAKDGGKGAYEHKFSSPRPYIVYDTRNKLLSFAGGGYSIPAEGIDG